MIRWACLFVSLFSLVLRWFGVWLAIPGLLVQDAASALGHRGQFK